MIAGASFLRGAWKGDASYYFSRFATTWGWASWRRAWRQYDGEMTTWPAFRDDGGLERLFPDPAVAAYFRAIFEKLRVEGTLSIWDYQWMYACMAGGGLTAIPGVNLVSNIGFGAEATIPARTPWAGPTFRPRTSDSSGIPAPSPGTPRETPSSSTTAAASSACEAGTRRSSG